MNLTNLIAGKKLTKVAASDGGIRPPSPGARDAVTQDLVPLITVGPQDRGFARQVLGLLEELTKARQQKTQLYDRLVLHKPTEQSDQFFFEDIRSVFLKWVAQKKSESDTSVAAQIAEILTSNSDSGALQNALAVLFEALGSKAQVPENGAYRIAGGQACAVVHNLESFMLYQDPETGFWGDLSGNAREAADRLEEFLRL